MTDIGASQAVPRHSAQYPTQHGPLAKLSLEHKLPLIIATLLVIAIGAISIAAYVEMRATSLRVASARVLSSTNQFRDLFAQSTGQLRRTVAAVANDDAVVRYARTRNPRDSVAALAALRSASQPDQIIASEIRDARNNVLLSTHPDRGVESIATDDILPRAKAVDSAALGRYRVLRDTTFYPLAAPIRGSESLYVVRWRRVAGSQRTRETLSRLVGADASIFIGNADGSHWSDLERPIAGFPAVVDTATQPQIYRRGADSARHLAAAAAIPGSPWAVAIDFPLNGILAPVTQFTREMALIATVALALGLLASWLVSRRITMPLTQLTEAAGAVAAGDFSKRVLIKRSDELGRLGRAFAVMADEVQHARHDLEARVEQRTRELNDTLKALHDAQESLVRKEKLAMLGQLSSGVGHELRNPLGVMTNAVYYLKAVLTQQPPNIHEYLDILSQQIALSEKIVSDLLDFARQKPPRRAPTRLAEAAQAQIARLASSGETTIRNELSGDLPVVLADPVQLGQVILNLLTNASQAMNGKGTITLRASQHDTRVTLEVSDTGPGVAQENFDRIFEPLFTTKARGIGLGLAVSRALARANGGDLTVDSAPGQGATFRLTLESGVSSLPGRSPADAQRGALV